jgi:ABC-type transport system involved in multi-copper enzyme maturation permease subunit
MVLEKELLPYLTWLLSGSAGELGALPRFLITAIVLAVLALAVGYLIAMVRYGPLKAGDLTYRVTATGVGEMRRISPRRIWALARLAIKESLRGRVIVALVVFLLILLFAGWFLKTGYQQPAKLLFSFVLTATTYLVLLIALLISAFSLPNDFKSKTIYTVVTKPVRAGDIVLGRILGFTIVGTVLLAVMSVCGYVFVVRTLNHTHSVDVASLENIVDADGNVIGKKGRTTLNDFHRHPIELDADGHGTALSTNSHEHDIELAGGSGEAKYRVSGPIGYLRARVPRYGQLRFLDRKGVEVAHGINVGNEWTYRSFIEGGSQSAAIWTLSGIDQSVLQRDDEGKQFLPLELIVRVFRSYKGDIEQGIQGSIRLQNPDQPDLKTKEEVFTARDASINALNFPSKLYAGQELVDLLEDVVTEDGRLEVVVQCLDRAQYFGFAQADCYLRLPDASPLASFAKAQVGIWVQMVLVIAIGVTCSTVLNGPVAMLFTISFITIGFFREFFISVATGKAYGGGPLESLVRLVTQKNLITALEESFGTHLVKGVDAVLQSAMLSLAQLLPDFRAFSTVDYVAEGFNIPGNQLAQDATVLLAYIAGSFVIGYFFLRTREVAK